MPDCGPPTSTIGGSRALHELRALPTFAAARGETWRRVRTEIRPHRVMLDKVLASGFTLLGERPGEELVLGTVGRFWHAGGETCPISPDQNESARGAQPGQSDRDEPADRGLGR